jgi:hypothetical protein
LQFASQEQVHRHDRELGRQHLQAHLSVRPPAGVSQLAAPCDPAHYALHWRAWRRGAASVGGAALGALVRRGEAVAASERGVLRSTMADGCCNPSGRLQCRRRRCCAGTAGVLTDARQHSPPIRTARRTPSRPIAHRCPSHRRPMGRGRGLRSAIARGESCAAGGAGAVDAIRVGCRRSLGANELGGTLPPELGRLTDLVDL